MSSPILSTEQLIAAEGAKRLLDDPIFRGAMETIVNDATENAISLHDANEREANRQLVLAVGRIIGTLEAAVSMVDSIKLEEQRVKSFE